jgi:PHO85 cyclin-5
VHEVLRRSRTSCSVLQTALCYIEALRLKIPELVHQERTGEGIRGEVDQGTRVLFPDDQRLQDPPKEVDIDEIIVTAHFATSGSTHPTDNAPPTVRMSDDGLLTTSDVPTQYEVEKKLRTPSEDLPALPPLPSPLLCPRRTFLASLILASKFMQDKCYSNRAWAKLAGLPAREIGRCERALGEALEWRLWVGKMPVQRVLPRSQSAGELFGARASIGSNASMDAFPPAALAVRRSGMLPYPPSSQIAISIPTRMQGPWMPTPDPTAFEYSPTPTLSASPATTDASSDSLNEERTVQMTFVDHVPDPDSLKETTPAIVPAFAYAYAGEGGISRGWNGFAWNATGTGTGWVRGDADSQLAQH